MNKGTSRAVIGWFKNSTVDVDKILDYFGISKDKKTRAGLKKIARDIRIEQWGKWGLHE